MARITVPIKFINEPTKEFYECTARHSCICGGFGSGKTYIGAYKALTFLTSYSYFRLLVARFTYKKLKETTMKTFYKLCPPELYDSKRGGRRNDYDGYLRLINGSEVLFVHLDEFNEELLRGIELNAALLDQAEELPEGIVDVLDTRLGRWDRAVPNPQLLKANPDWPRDDLGRYRIPAYLMMTCNPEFETHWIWRKFHPDSPEHKQRYQNYAYFEVSSEDNKYLDPETLAVMKSRDPAWVRRFVKGLWGISEAQIHRLLPESLIDPSKEWLDNFIKKATLVRALDHGDSNPTCCLWFAAKDGIYIAYREYYRPNALVSEHRRAIHDLSEGESYSYSVADPQIFKPTQQKYGGFWCVADEYTDPTLGSPPLHFTPADNNEFATRNRINEYLRLHRDCTHPISGLSPAPKLYIVERNPEKHNYGCAELQRQIKMQRRLKLATMDGKDVYGDERDDKIEDHAYDPFRYYVASHGGFPSQRFQRPSENSFFGVRKRMKAMRMAGTYTRYGDLQPRI